ncbi:presenilin-like protein At1g08700 [Dendrobium catenatum]|uniref:Presenilin n=1 Tax=Dendrobium catenatum TaxID=906689 RepID=A0A2I0VST0_9ASPA|nr:presenilin-like protein At1g08700 [Dendrobium catenatum]XP_020692954.1 presenilin-like protein At1g08700 [Dendrobium catenatum]XP_020692955.1 presenilin-like protein At1g08700 [Dendrobium catenatum]XP_028555930.1 presenilin-like protein At1g08700 [Dendrobium catenatum]XP_028555931.1 presenilin-like protein At1g08700 [Dendrobium catenatum]XP_028555932.1 presenilin-like protein At1g08700 [Dendrobium catenatum]PKU66463.1 Presenilin-like protein [Dendrobium catenatum]
MRRRRTPTAMDGSILDSLGQEIVGVMSPVSICMLLVVLLVSCLSPLPSSIDSPSSTPVTAATLVYLESPSDPPAKKLAGALLNAAVFVVLVAAVTFLLVILYYYNFTGFLKAYMRFSAFFVLASMGGSILFSLFRRFSLSLDAPSAILLLLNFSVIGVLSIFSPAVPIVVRQSYMVALAIIVAAWFTKLPEWTTWTLLLALAAYDLAAVLCPRGPLRILVDLASSRDEELPALVYEARPTASNHSVSSSPFPAASVELQPQYPVNLNPNANPNSEPSPNSSSNDSSPGPNQADDSVVEIESLAEETLPLVPAATSITQLGSTHGDPISSVEQDDIFETSRGIRLGLGDFVFYSVLVGRAAMFDLMTVYACYLAIISGLGCTLILLSICRHALPALPISITLGVVFYFLTRLVMEPFVVGASTSLIMF